MKKIFKYFIFICIAIMCFTLNVFANSLKSITVDVYIDSDGDAYFTTKYYAYLNQGTEGFFDISKEFNISELSVYDDRGYEYEIISNWNLSASFDNKANKAGIHSTGSANEICWGISQYGTRTYTIKYKIDDFVTNFSDSQGIYYSFVDVDQDVQYVIVTLRSDIPLTVDNSKIWAIGFDGKSTFDNGKIVFETTKTLKDKQHVDGLVRFDSPLFETSRKSSKSFDSIYDAAIKGEKHSFNFKKILLIMIVPILSMIFPLILFTKVAKILFKRSSSSSSKYTPHTTDWDFGVHGKNLPNINEVNYIRDIPCNKDIFYAYWLGINYKYIPVDDLKIGLVGAVLLKWIKEGKITVKKTEQKKLFGVKYVYDLDLNNIGLFSDSRENDLAVILKEAAGPNNILESEELEKWCRRYYYKFTSWFGRVYVSTQNDLIAKNLITEENTENHTQYTVSEKLYNDAVELLGLKRFLKDFSIINERQAVEVAVWEDYLIFANILGIADEVYAEFKKLYPDLNINAINNVVISTEMVRSIARSCYDVAQTQSEKAARSYDGSSSSSGGGGSSFSSSGGGSHASGSSSGGFR